MNAVLEQISKIGIVPVVKLTTQQMHFLWQRHFAQADFPVQRLPSVPAQQQKLSRS